MKNAALFLLFGLIPAIYLAQEKKDSLSVYFDTDKYSLTAQHQSEISSFIQPLATGENSILSVEITGYCDAPGTSGYNMVLSNKRANAVKVSLANNSALADFSNYSTDGKGSKLANGSTSNADWRRVDLIVTSKIPEKKKEEVSTNLDEIASGEKLVLQNLNFEGGRSQLLPGGDAILEDLYQKLVENPSMTVEIQGHVCCTKPGKDGFDKDTKTFDLSLNRARAVYDILIEKGVDAERLKYVGMKGDHPLVPELTIEDMVKNRRVEIKVLTK